MSSDRDSFLEDFARFDFNQGMDWNDERQRLMVLKALCTFLSDVSDICTMVENSQEYRLQYWATRSSIRSHRSLVRSFARTAHSWDSE